MVESPPRTVADFSRLGAVGLEIARCPHCGTCTQALWRRLAVQAGDAIAEAVRRMACAGCGRQWPEVSVVGYFGPFEDA